MSFVDDRAFWSSSETHLQVAKVQSDLFDRTFNFRCDVAKCHVASRKNELETLGVAFDLRGRSLPRLSRYTFDKANARLLCIRAVSDFLPRQAAVVRALVLPLMSWAGAMASIEPNQVTQLRNAVAAMANNRLACDTPIVQPFLKSSDGTVILLSCGFGRRFELPFLWKTGLHVGLRTPRSGLLHVGGQT